MAENTKVTLAWPLERDGVKHKADSTISLPKHEAAELLRGGLARIPEGVKTTDLPASVASAAAPATAKEK